MEEFPENATAEAALKDKVKIHLATTLGISASRIRIISLLPGSVVASFVIVEPSPRTSASGGLEAEPELRADEAREMFLQQFDGNVPVSLGCDSMECSEGSLPNAAAATGGGVRTEAMCCVLSCAGWSVLEECGDGKELLHLASEVPIADPGGSNCCVAKANLATFAGMGPSAALWALLILVAVCHKGKVGPQALCLCALVGVLLAILVAPPLSALGPIACPGNVLCFFDDSPLETGDDDEPCEMNVCSCSQIISLRVFGVILSTLVGPCLSSHLPAHKCM